MGSCAREAGDVARFLPLRCRYRISAAAAQAAATAPMITTARVRPRPPPGRSSRAAGVASPAAGVAPVRRSARSGSSAGSDEPVVERAAGDAMGTRVALAGGGVGDSGRAGAPPGGEGAVGRLGRLPLGTRTRESASSKSRSARVSWPVTWPSHTSTGVPETNCARSMSTSSSASTKGCARGKRSAALAASTRRSTGRSSRPSSPRERPCLRDRRRLPRSSNSKIRRPDSASNSTAPNANRSLLGSVRWPWSSSGAWYRSSVAGSSRSRCLAAASGAATPKCSSRTSLDQVSIRLDGLGPPCSRGGFCRWPWSRASAASMAMRSAMFHGMASPVSCSRSSRRRRLMPST